MSILYQDGIGFHFAYSTGKPGAVVPFDASRPDQRIVHYLCGEPAYFPIATFVPLDTAEQIVKDFIATGKPLPVVRWESGVKLRCGDPDG
jgi:hypothetical protein